MKKIILLILIVVVLVIIGISLVLNSKKIENNNLIEVNQLEISGETNIEEINTENNNLIEVNQSEISGEMNIEEINNEDDFNLDEYLKSYATNDYKEGNKTLFFFYNWYLGYYQDNSWHINSNIKLKDLFGNSYFTAYGYNNEKQTTNKLRIEFNNYTVTGQFLYEGMEKRAEYDYETDDNILGRFASNNKDNEYEFLIPNSLDEKLNESMIYNLTNINFLDVTSVIATNAEYGLKFIKERDINKLPDDVINYIEKQLIANGVSKDIPYHIDEYYKADLNNDGKEEEIFVVVSNDTDLIDKANEESKGYDLIEEFLKMYGGFSAIIFKDGDKINLLDSCFTSIDDVNNSDYSMVGTTLNFNLKIVDLNNDNIYELLYDVSGYELYDLYFLLYENDTYVEKLHEAAY